ncbi:MAG: dihydroflavonol-4-reductase [Halioglobus sp.]|jgi:dihydroflavonol-4-reductase
MQVMVTGGTGFVGSHVTRQLQSAGHEVVLLVRDEDKARQTFTKLNLVLPTLVKGDVTDVASIERALQGCDAVVHAAAGTPINAGDTTVLYETNVHGTRNVIDGAIEAGIAKIVYISSITAIFNTDASKVNEQSPLTPSTMAYGNSKVEAERYLRELQDGGVPISIIYPGGIIGPDDPGLSDTFKALIHRFNEGFRITEGGMQHVDVRDLTAFVCALLQREGSAGRFLLPGPFLPWSDLADLLEDVSGFPLKKVQAKGWVFRAVGRYYDFKRRFTEVDSPISAETMRYSTLWPNVASSSKFKALGLSYRDPRHTFADSLRWLGEAGYLKKESLTKLFP